MTESDRPAKWKPNWRAWAILIVVLAALGLLIPWLHARQIRSTLHKIRERAEQAEAAAEVARSKGDREAYLASLREAVRGYDAYLRQAPDDTETLNRLASAVAAQAAASPGNSQLQWNAYQILNRAVSKSPKDGRLQRRLAEFAERLQRWSEAAEAWRAAAQLTPDDSDARLHWAQCLAAQSLYQDAVKVLREAIAADPRNVAAYILLAQCYRRPTIGDATAAEEVLAELGRNCGDDPAAYAQRARFRLWLRRNTRNPQEAAESLQLAETDVARGLELAPNNVAVRIAAADLALEKGDAEAAESHLTATPPSDAEDSDVLEIRRRVAAAKGDFATLQTVLAKLSEQEPARLAEWFQVCLDRIPPDLTTAKQVLDRMRAASFSPDWIDLFTLRLQAAEGDLRPAAQGLEALLQRSRRGDPWKAEVALALSQVYLELRQWERSAEVLGSLLQESPDSRKARLAYAQILARLGEFDRASAELRRLAQELGVDRLLSTPGAAADYLEVMVQAAVSGTGGNKARSEAEDLIQRYPDRLPAWQRISSEARLKAAAGDTAGAEAMLDQALAQQGDALGLWSAKVDVQVLSGDSQAAAATAREVVRKFPKAPEAVLLLIRTASRAGDRDAGLTMLAEARRAAETLEEPGRDFVLRAVAAAYLKRNDAAGAAELWTRLANSDAQDVESRRLLFELARARGDDAEMQKQLSALRAAAPDRPETIFAEAAYEIASATKEGVSPDRRRDLLRKADEKLNAAERARAGWSEFSRLRAELAVLQGRWDSAIRILQDLHARGLATEGQTAQLVQLLFLTGREDEAEAVLSSIKPDRQRPELRRIQAELLVREGKIDEAIAASEQDAASSPDPIEYMWQARLLTMANRLDEAEQKLRAAVALAPDWPAPYLSLISLAVVRGKKDAALQVLQEAGGRLRGAAGYCALGLGYETVGDTQSAEKSYQRALEVAPLDPGPILEWAGFLIRTRRWEDGRRVLEELAAASDPSPESQGIIRNARRNLAQLLAADGDYRNFRRALDLLDQNLRENDAALDRFLKIRLTAARPEKSLRNQAVTAYEKEAQAGATLPIEDRFQWAVALESLGRWPDARARLAELFRPRARSGRHLEFYIRKLIEHDSPAGEIRPLLQDLETLAPSPWTADELKARLAAREGDLSEAARLLAGLLPRGDDSRPRPPITLVLQWFEELGLYQEAESRWQSLVASQPQAVLGLAGFLGRRGRTDEALALCRSALQTVAPDSAASAAVGILRDRREDCTPERIAAVEEMMQAAEKASGRTRAWLLTRGNFLHLTGRHQDAAPVYRELLERQDLRDMERAAVQNNLAYVLAAAELDSPQEIERNLREAESLVDQAEEVLGPRSNILDTRALIELRRGRAETALKFARRAVNESPEPLNYLHLVMALDSQGDTVGATREWETARRVYDLRKEVLPPLEHAAFERLKTKLERP
ncbi:tetratricopeptide repeat protein [Thermopirellula anaerolimosa]